MTKGIWIYCAHHPIQESQVLVLLDTEGLDDAMKVKLNFMFYDQLQSMKIFLLYFFLFLFFFFIFQNFP